MRAAFALVLSATAWAQSPSTEIDVSPSLEKPWIDTGIDVRVGDTAAITASGTLTLAQNRTCGPDGQSRGFRDVLKNYPVK